MREPQRWRRIVRGLLRRERLDAEIHTEMQEHVELEAEELARREGLDPREARRRALAAFGGLEQVKEQVRDVRRLRWLEDLRQDVVVALRTLRQRPAFAAAAVLTLALGTGATTAIFAVVDEVLLRPLPFEEPDRLVMVRGVAGPDRDIRDASYPEILDWAAMTNAFSDLSIYAESSFTLSGGGPAEFLEAELVSAGFFRLLGVPPQLGRGFTDEDDRAGLTPPVVISHDLWQRRFGGARDAVGRTITLDGRRAAIVGIMPDGFGGFSFDAATDIWATLLPWSPGAAEDRGSRWLAAIGRLAPGVSVEAAQADLWSAASRLETVHPDDNADRSADLQSLHAFYLDQTRTLLFVLLGAVAFLLLIASVNVMNLQLVRGLTRGREVAMRYALGARRGRLVRQMATEAAVPALVGGLAGTAVAFWSLDSLLALVPAGLLPGYATVSIDARVFLFAAVVIGCAAVLAGIVPALQGTRRQQGDALRVADRGALSANTVAGRVQRVLVGVEVALAVALMAGAVLMARSLSAQLDVAPGFQPEGVLVARVNLIGDEYPPEARIRFVRQLVRNLEAAPGVAAVGVGWDAPLRDRLSAAILAPEGQPDARVRYYRHRVTPGYFRTLGIPIRGRGFESSDDAGAPRAVIVSEAFAKKVWPGIDPVGRSVQTGPDPDADRATVVGVAGDVRFRDLTSDLMDPGEDPDVYIPYADTPTASFDVLVRSSTSEVTPVDVVRQVVAELDPSVSLARVQSLEDALAAQTASASVGSAVLGLFALLALVLSGIGLYGVMAYLVASRRREIAIRIALGANRARVLRLVVQQGMMVVAAGAAAGLAVALVGSRLFSSLLFGVGPADPVSLMVVVGILTATAAIAHLVPTLRALAIEPQAVLRGE